jgi:hypothetical protein
LGTEKINYLFNSLILILTNNHRTADKIIQNIKQYNKNNFNNLKLMNELNDEFLFEMKKKF